MQQIEDGWGETRFYEELGQALSAERRALGWLEHERVAGNDCERKHPQRDHHRKVEGRDSGAHTNWVAIKVLVDTRSDISQPPPLNHRRTPPRQFPSPHAPP